MAGIQTNRKIRKQLVDVFTLADSNLPRLQIYFHVWSKNISSTHTKRGTSLLMPTAAGKREKSPEHTETIFSSQRQRIHFSPQRFSNCAGEERGRGSIKTTWPSQGKRIPLVARDQNTSWNVQKWYSSALAHFKRCSLRTLALSWILLGRRMTCLSEAEAILDAFEYGQEITVRKV